MSADSRPPLVSLPLVMGLVAVSLLSLAAFFALLAYAPDFRNETDGGAHALSHSAIGFAGLRFLLDNDGLPDIVDRGTFNRSALTPALTIFTPGVENEKLHLPDAIEPRLVILPKWLPVGDPLGQGRVMKVGMFETPEIAAILVSLSKSSRIVRFRGERRPALRSPWPNSGLYLPSRPAAVDSLQTLEGRDWQPIITAAGGGAVLARLRGSEIYVLADPDFMNTHGLGDPGTAAMAISIVRLAMLGTGPVVFDVTLNGFRRSPSLLRDMFAPPFLGATLCALLAAFFLGFHAMMRFGSPPREDRVFAFGKEALVDNTAALIRMMHREPQMAGRYANAMRNLALLAIGQRRDGKDADALIHALERGAGETFEQLRDEAHRTETRTGLTRIAMRLFDWKQRITHAA